MFLRLLHANSAMTSIDEQFLSGFIKMIHDSFLQMNASMLLFLLFHSKQAMSVIEKKPLSILIQQFYDTCIYLLYNLNNDLMIDILKLHCYCEPYHFSHYTFLYEHVFFTVFSLIQSLLQVSICYHRRVLQDVNSTDEAPIYIAPLQFSSEFIQPGKEHIFYFVFSFNVCFLQCTETVNLAIPILFALNSDFFYSSINSAISLDYLVSLALD